jgi:hypothetical protein
MSEVIAGVRIPDSKLAREATELLQEHGTPLLFDHSLRVYLLTVMKVLSVGSGIPRHGRGSAGTPDLREQPSTR